MGQFPAFTIIYIFLKILTKVIIASVIMASVTIIASVTYGKCKCNYGKNIMANETEPIETRALYLHVNNFLSILYMNIILQGSWFRLKY